MFHAEGGLPGATQSKFYIKLCEIQTVSKFVSPVFPSIPFKKFSFSISKGNSFSSFPYLHHPSLSLSFFFSHSLFLSFFSLSLSPPSFFSLSLTLSLSSCLEYKTITASLPTLITKWIPHGTKDYIDLSCT